MNMSKWVPLAPNKPGQPSTPSKFNILKPSKPITRTSQGPFIGRFPEIVVLNIVSFLPIPDLPNVARGCKALARVVRDERGWEARCRLLGLKAKESLPKSPAPRQTPPRRTPRLSISMKHRPSVSHPSRPDDDFGDFSTDNNEAFEDVDFGDFGPSHVSQTPTKASAKAGNGNGMAGGQNGFNMKSMETSLIDFDELPLPSRAGAGGKQSGFFALTPSSTQTPKTKTNGASSSSNSLLYGGPIGKFQPGVWYATYKDHHVDLVPLCRHLQSSPSPSSTLALLFPPPSTMSLVEQSHILLKLLLFLSPALQPLRDWGFLRQALLSASDRFDSTCLVAFEMADSRHNLEGMKSAAEASWSVWEAGSGTREQWECGRVWVEKREVFYETSKWDSLENIVKVQTSQGAMTKQLDFTPMDAFISHVLEAFRADAETAAQVFPPAARVLLSFCDRVANDVIGEYITPLLSQARVISLDIFLQATAASFVQAWKLVDVAMSVIGDDPSITRTSIEDVIYRMFEVNMDEYLEEETECIKQALDSICKTWDHQLGASENSQRGPNSGPTFLNASNPDQVKRNVLAGFKDVLMLPVTIVPRTVTFGVNAIVSGGSHAVNGLSMLNPQKWAGSAGSNGAQLIKDKDGDVIFDVPTIDDEKDEIDELEFDEKRGSVGSVTLEPPVTSSTATSTSITPVTPTSGQSYDKLQLLVSLDVALELIHADRDALKRTETFANYPGKYGHRVRETIEEIFILMLKAAADRHIAPGFRIATNQMSSYKPAEHEGTKSVAPLLQFFELVHVGDTIQSMAQVYFDQEMTKYVDKTDFLNSVMREKKRFESVLDDAVAAGLNAGIEVLMNQVEHIIQIKTGPREYYPDENKPMDLGPTEGCREAIACLEMHCNLLKGSTSKEVLEVFYQEVGIRLQQILQRHLKRQIISLSGGFQIIADLNAYHGFVSSLKQQRITDDFANLKMLGHVYIVSDAKDLAQIVRDVTRYGGTFTPEDIYEFIQRRADWKKIEKTVDKAMYALSVKEDCVIM